MIQRDLGDGSYASFDDDMYPPEPVREIGYSMYYAYAADGTYVGCERLFVTPNKSVRGIVYWIRASHALDN